MATGTVKWFNDKKGYGFIALPDGEEVFVHHTQIKMEGFRTLKPGQKVSFEIQTGEKGPHASHVVPEPTP